MKNVKEKNLLIAFISLVFAIGVAWGVNTIKVRQHGLAIVKYVKVEKRVANIEKGNESRDEKLAEASVFIKEFQQWKIEDARWKGQMEEIVKQSLFYGSLKDI